MSLEARQSGRFKKKKEIFLSFPEIEQRFLGRSVRNGLSVLTESM